MTIRNIVILTGAGVSAESGLATFRGSHGTDWSTTMTMTVLVILPVIVLFFFAQKTFVEGITLTGVKG